MTYYVISESLLHITYLVISSRPITLTIICIYILDSDVDRTPLLPPLIVVACTWIHIPVWLVGVECEVHSRIRFIGYISYSQ